MKRRCSLTMILAFLLAFLAACGQMETPSSEPAESASPVQSAESLPPPETEEPSPETVESTSPSPEVSEEPTPQIDPYLFGRPVEEGEAVEESWFEDAVFLGDSRTEGLQLFSGLKTGDFIWYKGMSVFKVDDPNYRRIEVDGQAMTMMEALALKEYGKVYIMIGINELGYPADSYKEALAVMVDRVKEIQPDAVIYLQTLPPVNEAVAKAKGLGSYIKNEKVNAFNEAIYQVAWEKQVALLDVAETYRTENGDLAADMAADGVHFYRQGYSLWYEYLKTHTADPERYAAGVPLDEPIVPVVPAPPSPEPTPSATPEPDPGTESGPVAGESVETAPSEEPPPAETVSPDPAGPVETETPEPSESVPAETPVPAQTPAPSEIPAVP